MFLWKISKVLWFVNSFFKIQKQYNQQFIIPYIEPFQQQYQTKLSNKVIKKIEQYYCLGVPITCASYAAIYGKKLSENERTLATITGIMTPLIDDFTDEKTLSQAALDHLTKDPHSFNDKTVEESIVKNSLCTLLAKVKDPEGFLSALHKTIQAQHWSAKQMDANTTSQELLQISIEKGAWSHIFFHYLNDEIPSASTIEVLHLMGGLLQLSNDIFDVYKDYQEGIFTYANTCDDYNKLELYFIEQARLFNRKAFQLPYRKKDIEFFVLFMSSILGRGLVALSMLKKLQRNLGGGQLPISKLDRKQLICDMEKPINMVKTAWYTYQIVH